MWDRGRDPWCAFRRAVAFVLASALLACAGAGGEAGVDQAGPDTSTAAEASPDTQAAAACRDPGTADATAGCLTPRQDAAHYVSQGLAYFDTLDAAVEPGAQPLYADLVARWEWPPWLKLTGYGRDNMNATASLLMQFDPPTVPIRECRAFAVQPFCRCVVSFQYEGGPCPIYEEFVFNDQGEITFIEAWSDRPGKLPGEPAADRWGEDPAFPRLSTRVPGLGNPEGRIDLDSPAMHAAEAADPDVADFARRARDPWATWAQELKDAGPDLYARGCGW